MKEKKILAALGTLALLLVPASAMAADSDGDGLDDAWEISWFGTLAVTAGQDVDLDGLDNLAEQAVGTNPLDPDSDLDGLSDYVEVNQSSPFLASSPLNADTDGDQLPDGEEIAARTSPNQVDSDGDGLSDYAEVKITRTNPLALDSDNGFSDDGREVLIDGTNPNDPNDDTQDSDKDGISDYQERLGGTNRLQSDTDSDGLPDAEEIELGTNPAKADTDGDYLTDGEEILYYKTDPLKQDTDDDELTDSIEITDTNTNPLFADTDWDTLKDGFEVSRGTNPLDPDTDGGGILDPVEIWESTDPNNAADDPGRDTDGDGLSDNYEIQVSHTNVTLADTDADNMSDAEEVIPLGDHQITFPTDADTDDDGILDGNEGGILWLSSVTGGTLPIAPDTDSDGLLDGVERGLSEPQVSLLDPDATNMTKFRADADPTTTTHAVNNDTDGDGLKDGLEDRNHDGKWDSAIGDPYWPDGETNPNNADTDGDTIDDAWEVQYSNPDEGVGPPLNPLDPDDFDDDPDADGLTNVKEYRLTRIDPITGETIANQTNPRKADTDEDLLNDGKEYYSLYGGGLKTDPNNPDSDGDGVLDGVEDKDLDGRYDLGEMNPTKKDTDGDSLADGIEDRNLNGVMDPGETNPTKRDTDDDGLSDGSEFNTWGTDPLVTDTDDDGLGDGLEVGFGADTDPATRTNPKKADTDGDGLADGDEDKDRDGAVDVDETDPASRDTDGDRIDDGVELGLVGDADPNTATNPLDRDTDGDRLPDGFEDKNRNGALDALETDPADADTDNGGVPDGIEVFVDFTDPLNPLDDRTGDPDGDGIQTWQEILINTDPLNPDTDGDNISDGDEVGPDQANPRNTDDDEKIDALDDDSDGDGILDMDEAGDEDWRTLPRDTNEDGVADYIDEDSDGDGISDRIEYNVDSNLDGEPDHNVDGDDLENHLDPDTDDDGKLDEVEGTGDQDDDGIPNFADADDNTPFVIPESDAEGSAEMAEQVEYVETPSDVIEDSDAFDSTTPDNGGNDVGNDLPGNDDGADAVETDAGDALPTDVTTDVVEEDDFQGKLQGGMMCSQSAFRGHTAEEAGHMGWLAVLIVMTVSAAFLIFRRTTVPGGAKRRTRHSFHSGRRAGMPRRYQNMILSAFATLLLFPAGARADDPGDIPAKRYSLKSGATSILSTDSGQVMEFLEYEVGMSFMWAGPSIIKQVDAGTVVNNWLQNRFDSEVWAGVGIFKRVDLTFSMPVTWYQKGMAAGGGDAAHVGVGGISFVPRINILDERRGDETTLGLVTEFVAPTMKGSYFGSGSFEFVGKLAMSMTRLNFTMAMNLWYRFVLNDRTAYNVEDDDQLGFALGIAYQFKKIPLRIMADASVAVPVVRPFFEKEEVFSEAMFGVGYRVWNFVIQVAGGAGIAPGIGVPDGRLLASLAWSTAGTKKVKNREERLQEDLDKEAAKKTAGEAVPVVENKDKCPDQDEDIDEFEDEDGCPDHDNDADKVLDKDDKCPNQAGPVENEGCPLKDSDGDGVDDHLDKCPDKAGPKDNDGCPKEVVYNAEVEKKLDTMLGDMVMFSFKSAVINQRFYPTLDKIAEELKKLSENETIVVEGHASLTGPRIVNKELSGQRALAVKKYLVSKGIPADKIEVQARGVEAPIIPDKGLRVDPLNQRVQFRILIGK